MRELHEEYGLVPRDLAHAGKARFTYQGKDKEVEVHFFKITDFSGEPVETEEMKPQWFHIQELPYQNMWPDDVHWMPHFLSGQKFEGTFVFEGFDKILNHEIQ